METEKWTAQIDKVTNDFRQAFGALTGEQLNWKPHAQIWSIAQNIEHLIIINESYYPLVGAIREGNYTIPFIGKIGFINKFLGKTLLNSVQPDRRRKIKTFPLWEPAQSDVIPDILNRFEKHQEGLKQLIVGSRDLLEKGTLISSPANKYIVYKLEAAFDILVTHEQRHFQQAKEVLAELNDGSNAV